MSICFKFIDSCGDKSGRFSDALLWDYNDIAIEIDESDDVLGAIDWIVYNISLTEEIYGVISDDAEEILVYDITNVDFDDAMFDEDPELYLAKHQELITYKFCDFYIED